MGGISRNLKDPRIPGVFGSSGLKVLGGIQGLGGPGVGFAEFWESSGMSLRVKKAWYFKHLQGLGNKIEWFGTGAQTLRSHPNAQDHQEGLFEGLTLRCSVERSCRGAASSIGPIFYCIL